MASDASASISLRAAELFQEQQRRTYKRTDHLFAGLLFVEWIAGIGPQAPEAQEFEDLRSGDRKGAHEPHALPSRVRTQCHSLIGRRLPGSVATRKNPRPA